MTPHLPPPTPAATLCFVSLKLTALHTGGATRYLSFCDGLTSLRIKSPVVIHVATRVRISFLFEAEWQPTGCTSVYLPLCPWTRVASPFWLLQIMLLRTWASRCLFGTPLSVLWGCISRSGISGSRSNSMFNFFLVTFIPFPEQLDHCISPWFCTRVPASLYPHQHCCFLFFSWL